MVTMPLPVSLLREPTLAGWRHRRSYTQAELAERAGLSRETIKKIECGRVQPSPRTRRRLCEALQTSPERVAWPRRVVRTVSDGA